MNRILFAQLFGLFFLQFFIWGSWFVTTGTYLLHTVGFAGWQVGLVYSATAIAALVSPFLLGALADQLFATEKLLSGLHLGGGLVMFGLSFIERFEVFFPLLIGYALLYMPTFALSTALSFHHLDSSSRQFPRVRVGGTLGWVVAGVLISYLDLELSATPLRISAAASLVAAVFCRFLPHTPPQPRTGKRSLRELIGPEIVDLLRRPSFAILVVSLVLSSIPNGFYYSFTNPFLTEIGMNNAAGKMSAGQLSEVIFMLLLPWLFVRLNFRWIITIGLAAWGIRYLLFAFGDNGEQVWMLWLGILLHGVAFNYTILTGQIYVDKIAPAHIRSRAQGFVSLLTMGLGSLLGANIAGNVVQHFSLPGGGHAWPSIWLIPAAVGLATTLFFGLSFREKRS